MKSFELFVRKGSLELNHSAPLEKVRAAHVCSESTLAFTAPSVLRKGFGWKGGNMSHYSSWRLQWNMLATKVGVIERVKLLCCIW